MQPPMIGAWQVQVLAARPFTIHGDLYYEVQVLRLDEPGGQGYVLRIPQHAYASEPKAGDRLNVTFLMGQVTGAKAIT